MPKQREAQAEDPSNILRVLPHTARAWEVLDDLASVEDFELSDFPVRFLIKKYSVFYNIFTKCLLTQSRCFAII
jgi:hypothetical protein